MTIYTRTGDDGTTDLANGDLANSGRIAKTSLKIEAVGSLDELSAFLGLARTEPLCHEHALLIFEIQKTLFLIGADLATVPQNRCCKNDTQKTGVQPPPLRISESHVLELESAIDAMEKTLSPLRTFLVPGETRASALLHVARTVCRRAERTVCALHETGSNVSPLLIQYLNRLSDLLFTMARMETTDAA